MRTLENDLDNFFATSRIIDKKMDPFAGSVVNKITTINTTVPYVGKFTAPLGVLTAAYNPFHTAMLDLPSDLTFGSSSVEVGDVVLSDFQHFASNYKGMIKDIYFEDHHEIYITFYPDDLTDINAMTKATALPIMTRFALAVHTNVADLTPELDTRAAAFVTRQIAATSGRDVATGSIGDDRSTRDTGRDALDEALFEAYNFSKYIFKCDYNKMHNVFPLETLLRHPRHEIEHYSGNVAALSTVNVAEALYDGTYIAMVRNISNSDMLAGLALTADTAITATNGVLIKANKSKSFIITSTGTNTDHFLNITNLNLTDAGNWEIDIFKQT